MRIEHPPAFLVERESVRRDGTIAYTGPMGDLEAAERARDSWIEAGIRARVIPFNQEAQRNHTRWKAGESWTYEEEQ